MDLEVQVGQAVAAIKGRIDELPFESYRILSEAWGRDTVQNDDYLVLWEMEVSPSNLNACPVGIYISSENGFHLSYGLRFDNQKAVSKRLGLRTLKWSSHGVGFGTEPTSISLDTVLKILSAVFEGKVMLRYIPIGKWLFDTAGEVLTIDGTERFGGRTLLSYFRGETYTYEPWC